MPKNEAQLKHIFRKKKGHLEDTTENRSLLESVANKIENYVGADKHGNEWYSQTLHDGSQVWVQVRGNTIQNGGVNNPPLKWNVGTGFSKP